MKASEDAFDMLWDVHDPDAPDPSSAEHPDVSTVVPAHWLPYMPYPRLNPAQAQAIPLLLNDPQHMMVVAPTGAGKTVIGMAALLTALFDAQGNRTGRKGVWLVPQRTLTDELDRDLEAWRRLGLRIERLSGEHATDIARTAHADVWVATTEKFEALARTSTMREAIRGVGVIVADEIHLIGDPTRGPVLEALIARIRMDAGQHVRVVGLSATVANADQMAEWLGAHLVRVAWRPTRLTWQVLTLPETAAANRADSDRFRDEAVVHLVDRLTGDDGSALVFCGTKKNVRSAAVSIAVERHKANQSTDRRPDVNDTDAVYAYCTAVGVGLHYSDWPNKREAERGFRNKELDVLVATSTVAAGVNLPARFVIVRDTRIGLSDMTVGMIQQMFGRAGRVGQGETEGWAYLLTDHVERTLWLSQLASGHQVNSGIAAQLEDHLLAELVQGRIRTVADARTWWENTFGYYQIKDTPAAAIVNVPDAVQALVTASMVTREGDSDHDPVTVTEMGAVTSRMMISVRDAIRVRQGLRSIAEPTTADDAEKALASILSTHVDQFGDLAIPETAREAIGAVVAADGHVDRIRRARRSFNDFSRRRAASATDLALAVLLLVARSPRVFRGPTREVAGIPYMTLFPVLAEAPRFLAWVAAQGYLGTVPPWAAIVAHDLGKRVRWVKQSVPQGSGRLLWMLEAAATGQHADEVVPGMVAAAANAGVRSPDWSATTPPTGSRVSPGVYQQFLDGRVPLPFPDGQVVVPAGSAAHVYVWSQHGVAEEVAPVNGVVDVPAGRNAAVFTRRGDMAGTGWLARYQSI